MKMKAFPLAAALLAGLLPTLAQAPPGDGGQAREGRGFGEGRGIRGTVTAIAPPFVTIKTDVGELWQVKLGPNARIVKGKSPTARRSHDNDGEPPETISLSDIHLGDMLSAGGDIDAPAKKVNAAFGFLLDAATVRQLDADWGITYIAGKITALDPDAAKLTIQRPDGKSTTIQADESTSFRRGHESITLADIKIGDSVTGRGAQKNGLFVPATLSVFDPAARRPRDSGAQQPQVSNQPPAPPRP